MSSALRPSGAPPQPGASFRRTVLTVGMCLVVAACAVPTVLLARPVDAAAATVASLQAQATAISQQLVQQQLRVGVFEQQYSVASARVSADAAAIAAGRQAVAGDQRRISADRARVRAQAITDYMDSGAVASGSDAVLFSTGGTSEAQALSEYQGIAVGRATTALDRLRTAQQRLAAEQSDLVNRQSVDRAALDQQGQALAAADSAARGLEAVQAQVTGRLAGAIAQQAAARDAAAAAAVRAAQAQAQAQAQAAAHRAASSPPATAAQSNAAAAAASSGPPASAGAIASGGSSPSAGTSDPALNPFLQCVVQAESGGDYGAVSPNGLYMGAFQFSQPTWNTAALAAGRPDLVGVPPNVASKADQDTVAVALYALDGEQPWLDRCHS